MNFLKRISVPTLVLLLAGCKSVGTQYAEPAVAEPSAVLFGSGGVYMNNFNQDGCYTGRTNVPDSIRLQPGKEVIASYEATFPDPRRRADNMFCRVVFAFTPKQGYSYRVVEHSGTNTGRNLMGQPVEVPVCRVVVEVEGPEGERSVEPVTQLVLRQKRLACIKAVPMPVAKGSSER